MPLVFMRVYSGLMTPRMLLHNNTRQQTERVEKLYVMHADCPVEVPRLSAGDIGAAFLTHTYTGDTLFAAPQSDDPQKRAPSGKSEGTGEVHTLEGIVAPPAVISFSVEAATPQQVPLLDEALSELSREDPSLRVTRSDYGNVVVSGMGELHLEIVMSRLQHEHKVHCRLMRAIIEYRESVRDPQRLENAQGLLNELPYAVCSLDLRPRLGGDDGLRCEADAHCSFHLDDDFVSMYTAGPRGDGGRQGHQRMSDARDAKEELRLIRTCFQAAVEDCKRMGPLAGMPLHGVDVVLTTFRKTGGAPLQEKTLQPVARSLVQQLIRAVAKKDLVIVEPMMEVEVHLSEPTYLGHVVTSLNGQKALTVDVQEDGRSVKAIVAMRNIVRYTMELRKAVKGHANLYSKLDHYRVIEDKAVLARIMRNMGMAE